MKAWLYTHANELVAIGVQVHAWLDAIGVCR